MIEESTFRTTPRWFGPTERPLLGWWTAPTLRTSRSGVVILPPIGYEYWSAHRTLRTLAEALAGRGHHVFRVDYDGLGDSAGERWDAGRVPAWRQTVAHAVGELRGLGAETITLVGLRMGASLALLEAAAARADRVVAWVPVTSGKRFMKELRMLGLVVPATEHRPEPGDTVVYAGTVFSPETTADLGAIDLDKLAGKPAPRVLVVARPDRPCDKLVARLGELGTDVELQVLPGAETVLDIPAEGAETPVHIVDAIAAWIGDAPAGEGDAMPAAPPRDKAELAWGQGRLTEEVVTIGASKLIGILGRPIGDGAKDTTIVFLNSGAEPHTGPGRCWVEYTRELNLAGYSTVRLDFSGWGESPDLGHAPGRPYEPHCIDEALEAFAALRADGHARVALSGLCAGAWIAMQAAQRTELDAVLAINPQLYWFPGCPLDARIADALERRRPIREREVAGVATGKWSALDAIGFRNHAGNWLDALADAGAHVLMLFAEGDDGLGFLHNRCGRRLRRVLAGGTIKLVTVADIDHQMYREWRRHDVVARMVEYLDAMPGNARA